MFDWKDYFKLAKNLGRASHKSKTPEACLRSAVSRAYYAAYHQALEFAKKNGFSVSEGRKDIHHALCIFLMGPSVPIHITYVGQKLDACRVFRGKCDYDDKLDFNLSRKTEDIFQKVEEILSQLQ